MVFWDSQSAFVAHCQMEHSCETLHGSEVGRKSSTARRMEFIVKKVLLF